MKNIKDILKLASEFERKLVKVSAVDPGAYQDVLNGGVPAKTRSGGANWSGFLGQVNTALLSGSLPSMKQVPDEMGFQLKLDVAGNGKNYVAFKFRVVPYAGYGFNAQAAKLLENNLNSSFAPKGPAVLVSQPHPDTKQPLPIYNGKLDLDGPAVKPAS